jgi:peroxiredoxin
MIPLLVLAAFGLTFVGLLAGVIWTLLARTGEARSRLLVRFLLGFGLWFASAVAGVFALVIYAASQNFPSAGRSATATRIGEDAPDFEFHPLEGSPKRLSDLRGKPVVLNFFATWCGPCMTELPELDRKVAQVFSERGVTVLVIGVGESERKIASLQRTRNFSFVMAPDEDQTISKLYVEGAIPCTYLIDGEGKIAHQVVGYSPLELDTLKTRIESALKSE